MFSVLAPEKTGLEVCLKWGEFESVGFGGIGADEKLL
jgi:hypothetical protein